jgi:hypothetical protein
LATTWGLLRYWWVAVKLALNLVLCTLILVILQPGMDEVAGYGQDLLTASPDPAAVSNLFFPPAVSLTTLILATVLAVAKPWGRIRRRAGRAGHDLRDTGPGHGMPDDTRGTVAGRRDRVPGRWCRTSSRAGPWRPYERVGLGSGGRRPTGGSPLRGTNAAAGRASPAEARCRRSEPGGVAALLGELLEVLDLDGVTLAGDDTGGALAQLSRLAGNRPAADHKRWGGWGSNPRPADYQKYGLLQHAR